MKIGDRAAVLASVTATDRWEVIVIGGGITGAGIAREAARRGAKVLLLEQRDFAWGTSSRSSKMVHGGLRYLGQGQIKLARKAVRERERLIREAPGLVERVEWVYPLRRGEFPGRIALGFALTIYDLLGRVREHHFLRNDELVKRAPGINQTGLRGAYVYSDGATDDARLVQRVLGEAVADGATVLNYAAVTGVLREGERVSGVTFCDSSASTSHGDTNGVGNGTGSDGESHELRADVVIDATGVWADALEPRAFDELKIRPLRGSHLVLAADRLAVKDTIIFAHPVDARPIFAYPWQRRMVIGTTDVDHSGELNHEARISQDEYKYLVDGVQQTFGVQLTPDDVIATWAGVRPVLSAGDGKSPSKERRDEAVWLGNGIVCASGGKLTTFRLTALQALKAAATFMPSGSKLATSAEGPIFAHSAPDSVGGELTPSRRRTLAGRFGTGFAEYMQLPGAGDETVADTSFALAELRYAARYEMVVHLDDLLLRRTRVGNVVPKGAASLFAEIEAICREELAWDDARWQAERERYQQIWRDHYDTPGP